MASVCKGKQWCARCSGNHEYGKCEEGVKPKCCICGEELSAAYGGCQVRRNAVKIQNVRITEGISYAEAIKRVKRTVQRNSQESEDELRMQRQVCTRNQKIRIINFYNPCDRLKDNLRQKVGGQGSFKLVWCGDFNAHDTLWGSEFNNQMEILWKVY